jgi:NADH-ubiquinone/plastoquinone oxidoreductase subunit 3
MCGATGEPYEGGIVSKGSARVRFSLGYYLIAMFFVIFDLSMESRRADWSREPHVQGEI